MKPICKDCGNVILYSKLDKACPICSEIGKKLTIPATDPRYLIFLAMIERVAPALDEIFEFEPTRRELEMLNHGDQILTSHCDQLWRIVAKTYGGGGAEPRVWISGENLSDAGDEQDGQYFLPILPPFIPQHLIDKVPLDAVLSYQFVPISENEDEIIFAGPPTEMEREDSFKFAVNIDKKFSFWSTTNSAFDSAVGRYYINVGSISNCSPKLDYQCPKRWETLEKTERGEVRFCDQCKENVYLVTNSGGEALHHEEHIHCVAYIPEEGSMLPFMGAMPPEIIDQ